MNPRDLLKKIGSMTAAAAVIAGPSYGDGTKQNVASSLTSAERPSAEPGAPKPILEPSVGLPNRSLAHGSHSSHSSHSSHASHYSHMSGSGGGGESGGSYSAPITAPDPIVQPPVAAKRRTYRSPIAGVLEATNVSAGARVARSSQGSVLQAGYIIQSIGVKKRKAKKIETWSDMAVFVSKIPAAEYEIVGIDSTGRKFDLTVKRANNLPGVMDFEDVDAGARIKYVVGDSSLRDGYIIQSIGIVGHSAQSVKTWVEIQSLISKNLDKDFVMSGIDSGGNRFTAFVPFSRLVPGP